MATRKTKPREFDEAVLQTMTEPISVTLQKVIAGKRSPVELPPGPGENVGGRGYDADMVRQLSSFIVNEWSGGGLYEATATGANGEQMKWDMFFPPNKNPELTPPTQANVAHAAAPAAAPAIAPAAPYSPPGGGNYLSQVAQSYRQTPSQPPFAGQPANGVAPQVNPYAWQPPFSQPPVRLGAPPVAAATGVTPDVMKEREARMKLEGQLERDRQQAQHEKEMAAITQEMRRMQDAISKRPDAEESAALKAAQDQIQALKEQSANQAMAAQFQSMQQQSMEMMRQMQDSTNKQIEAITRQMSEQAANKSDPMITVMMQSMQQQAQAQQQSMQMMVQMMQANQSSQVEAARLAQQNQMGPREMIDLFRSANQGADQMASAYGRAWELMANGVESILHAQGPGVHPALAMLGQAAEGGLGIAQQYLEMKEKETTANAQARSIQAQMEARSRIEAARFKAAEAAAVQAQSASEPIEAEVVDTEGQVDEEGVSEEDLEEAQREAAEAAEQAALQEDDLFGEALPHVRRLRMGVESGAISSHQCAAVVLQAVDHFGQAAAQGKALPPVFTLFQEERFADLIDALIPAAKPEFREEATQALYVGIENLKQSMGG